MDFFRRIKRIYNNKILKGSFELLLVIVSVFVVSYAWFVKTTENETKDLTIKTKASRMIYISLDDGVTWDTELSLNLDNFKFNNEVTGDGVNFYKALTKREDGMPITFKNAVPGTDYLEFDILFKANAPLGIFLDRDSFALPSAGIEIDNLIGINAVRKSTYGEFSRDLIAGALRISFTKNRYIGDEYIAGDKASLVWAPNKSYELLYNKGIYDFDLSSSNSQDYRYIDGKNGFVYKNVNNLKDNLNTDYDNDMANGDPMITEINPAHNDGIQSVTVRIWVEGNDRETHDALTGGSFRLNINFMGIVKEHKEELPYVYINEDNTIGHFVSGMEYSLDNGNVWVKYNELVVPTFNVGDVVLVRYCEDEFYYASDYVTLSF